VKYTLHIQSAPGHCHQGELELPESIDPRLRETQLDGIRHVDGVAAIESVFALPEQPVRPSRRVRDARRLVSEAVAGLGILARTCGPYSGHYDEAMYNAQQDRVAEAKRRLRVAMGLES
jgi:hypothetical protein